MNRTEYNSFNMKDIEIETLREQLVRVQNENKLFKDAFKFLKEKLLAKL